MHFRLVKIPNSEFTGIIMFDSKEFKPEDFNLEDVKEISKEDLIKEYDMAPLMSLNDFLLRSIKPNSRTTTHVLSECGIENYAALWHEYNLIELKKSNLSSSQRKLVQERYNEIINV